MPSKSVAIYANPWKAQLPGRVGYLEDRTGSFPCEPQHILPSTAVVDAAYQGSFLLLFPLIIREQRQRKDLEQNRRALQLTSISVWLKRSFRAKLSCPTDHLKFVTE